MSGIGDTHQEKLNEEKRLTELSTSAQPSRNKTASNSDERTMAVLSHILALISGFIAPLIFFLIEKDKNPRRLFVVNHAKESLNFQISMVIYIAGLYIIGFITLFIFIGFFFILLAYGFMLYALIVIIIATVKASNGEYFRYPLCIRFIS